MQINIKLSSAEILYKLWMMVCLPFALDLFITFIDKMWFSYVFHVLIQITVINIKNKKSPNFQKVLCVL